MKLSFSTLGCPSWSWKEILSTAKDIKMDGVELRGIEDEMYLPNQKIFNEKNLEKTLEYLKEVNLEVPILSSGIAIGLPDSYEHSVEEAKDYIELANKVGAKYIRVMITPSPEPRPTDIDSAKEVYLELCKMAREKGVVMLVETSGILSDSFTMAEFMSGTDSESAGVLWDIHHPYRYCAENPVKTYNNLKKYIKHVHIKDSVIRDSKVEYRMLGYGDIPIFDCLKLLIDNNYDGYVSLEWTKRWNKELQEPGVVFYHYSIYMQYLFEQMK